MNELTYVFLMLIIILHVTKWLDYGTQSTQTCLIKTSDDKGSYVKQLIKLGVLKSGVIWKAPAIRIKKILCLLCCLCREHWLGGSPQGSILVPFSFAAARDLPWEEGRLSPATWRQLRPYIARLYRNFYVTKLFPTSVTQRPIGVPSICTYLPQHNH